jgi:phosphoribosylglycinamide formyltransferase-1
MSHTIFESCRRAHVRYVAMGGFLQRVIVPPDFENRIVNIHPSLIPAFCGTGLYGRFVHEAVLQYGCKVSGCTVHFVDNQYDHGPIIAQRCVEVLPSDTPESLAARVFGAECELYPQVLGWLAASQVRVENRRVWIDAR